MLPVWETQLQTEMGVDLPVQKWLDEDSKLYEDNLRQKILELIVIAYDAKEAVVGAEPMRKFEKQVFLQVLDTLWKEHLSNMDHLRRGIHLRGLRPEKPEAGSSSAKPSIFFESMLEAMKGDVIRVLCHVKVQSQEELEEIELQRKQALANELARARLRHDETSATSQAGAGGDDSSRQAMPETFVRNEPKVGRNEPCPCGSGKKFKQCCGKIS